MTSTRERLNRWLWPLEQLGLAAFRFVFPPSCPLCEESTDSGSWRMEGHLVTPVLCQPCIEVITPATGNRCFRCGVTLGLYVKSTDGCPNCRRRGFRFSQVVRLGNYEDELRQACIRGKAPHQQPLAAALANLFWLQERTALEAANADLIAPVPRFWTRRLMQEHHSAETISRVLAQRLGLPLRRTLLHKIRWTTDQSDLAAAQRKKNLRNAFAVWFGRRELKGKTVLLVDDILTTGTTANECARALLNAGAKRVVVAVLAVVPPVRK